MAARAHSTSLRPGLGVFIVKDKFVIFLLTFVETKKLEVHDKTEKLLAFSQEYNHGVRSGEKGAISNLDLDNLGGISANELWSHLGTSCNRCEWEGASLTCVE